jgi:phosphoglycerate dehydrogenase-like enzyme
MDRKPVLYNVFAPADVYDAVRRYVPGGVELLTLDTPGQDERMAKIADCEVAIQASATFPAALVDAGAKLRLILHEGVGYQDTVDLPALRRRGIRLAITPEGTTVSVAEHTILLMLGVFKHVVHVHNELCAGRFRRLDYRPSSRTLYGTTVGYVGMGRIAQAVAERLKPFGTTGLYHDPIAPLAPGREAELGVRAASLEDVLSLADVVSVHTPLTAETRGMIDAAAIARMKPDAILVCTSRGGIIDEAAVVEAVGGGHLLGVGLDVFETEPLPAGHPLTRLPNVVLTPHSAGGSRDALRMRWEAMFENYRLFYAGQRMRNEIAL